MIDFKKVTKQITLTFATIGGYQINPPTGLRSEYQGSGALSNIIIGAFFFIVPIVGIAAFGFLVWSGFQYLTSKGDPKALEAAKARITYSIIGMTIVFMAYLITQFVATLFNLSFVP